MAVFPLPDDEEMIILRGSFSWRRKNRNKDGELFINDEKIIEDYILEPMDKEDFGQSRFQRHIL